ncbi:hypothetical protein M3Y98_00776400 [Aphelenchoides besseyi]|nr:hypothetical protein M3Y98_00776400 [Aphelenchoides besseyi]KAI6211792.1 hypothetical protein M3Y96_00471900 [Aphelenchoides besseyi]
MNRSPPVYADVNARPSNTENTTQSMEKEGHQLAEDKQSTQQANMQTTVPTTQTVQFAASNQVPTIVNSGTQMMFFDAHPIIMKCPYCDTEMRTKISYEAGTMAVVCFMGLLLVG